MFFYIKYPSDDETKWTLLNASVMQGIRIIKIPGQNEGQETFQLNLIGTSLEVWTIQEQTVDEGDEPSELIDQRDEIWEKIKAGDQFIVLPVP